MNKPHFLEKFVPLSQVSNLTIQCSTFTLFQKSHDEKSTAGVLCSAFINEDRGHWNIVGEAEPILLNLPEKRRLRFPVHQSSSNAGVK